MTGLSSLIAAWMLQGSLYKADLTTAPDPQSLRQVQNAATISN